MRILVVEDEAKTAAFLKQGLEENGYVVDVAATGDEGMKLARGNEYVLIALDIMLPGRDGWSILSELRQQGKQTPVVFLTAKDEVEDRVRGLELGADDYLVKPFAFSEFLARVRTVLRRGPVLHSDTLKVDNLEVDPVRHRVTREGKRLDLTPKEYTLLLLMMRRTGEVLTRTGIAEQVWGLNFDSDTNVVDVHIRRLRAKVDDPFKKKLIHTVRGAGYVLEDRS